MAGNSTSNNKTTASASKAADSGRVMNTDQSPRASFKARFKYYSIMGPSMNPSNSGAGSQPSLVNK